MRKEFDRKQVEGLIAEIVAAGFTVTSGDERLFVFRSVPATSRNFDHVATTPDGRVLHRRRVRANQDFLLYSVYPRPDWDKYVERCVEQGDKSWIQFSIDMGERLDEIMSRHGFRLGGVGGTPSNLDYTSPDGQVVLFYHGNPFRMA